MLKLLNSELGSFLEVLIWKPKICGQSFGSLSYLYCNKLFENCDCVRKYRENSELKRKFYLSRL